MSTPPWEKFYCRRCHAEVPSDRELCDGCSSETKPCLNCGEPIPAGGGTFCPKCASRGGASAQPSSARSSRLSPGVIAWQGGRPAESRPLRERIFLVALCLGAGSLLIGVLAAWHYDTPVPFACGIVAGLSWLGLGRLVNFIIGPQADERDQ